MRNPKEKDHPLTITEYTYNDIKKIDFRTEKDLINTLETTLQNTSDTIIDWKNREAAIKRIGGIILGNFGRSDTFYKYFTQKIHINLSTQLADLRSSVMKEACRIVALTGRELDSKRIENAIEKLLSQYVLYKLCGSANKVIADTCGNCIMLLVKYVQSVKIIYKVCEQALSKGTAMKLRCAQSLMIICHEYPDQLVLKAQQIIEDSIKVLMGDANGDVRATARKAYLIYKMHYKAQAGIFFNVLERSIQRQIYEDESRGVNIIIKYEKHYTNNQGSGVYEQQAVGECSPKIQRVNSNSIGKSSSNPCSSQTTLSYTVSAGKRINKVYSQNINSSYGSVNSSSINKEHNQIENKQQQQRQQQSAKPFYHSAGRIKPMILTKQNDNISKSTVFPSYNGNSSNNNNNNNNGDDDSNNVKKNILKNLNSRLEELSVITGGTANRTPINKVDEEIEPLIHKQLNIIEHNTDLYTKTNAFGYFYNNFTQIQSNLNTISNTTMRSIVDAHIQHLTESDKPLIIQIMKNLIKFFFYTSSLFTHFDINAIVKLLVTHLSSRNPDIEKMCNQLLEIIRKKNRNDIIFTAIFELLQEGDCEEDIAYTTLLPLIDNCVELLNDKEYYNEIFQVVCNGDTTNKALCCFIDKLYNVNQTAFTNAFTNEALDNQKHLLLILKTNEIGCYKDMKYIMDLQQYKLRKQNMKENENESSNDVQCNDNVDEDIEEHNTLLQNNINNVYIDSNKHMNNINKHYYNRPSPNLGHAIPKEISDAIFSQNINTFLQYISNNRNYIPHFTTLLSVKAYNPHLQTIIAFIYALLTSPLYINDLEKCIDTITQNCKTALVDNKDNQQVFSSLKEIFFLFPMKLNAEKTLISLSKLLSLTNDDVVLQVVLLSIKNFIMSNKDQNLFNLLPSFTEGVFKMLNHKSSDIRKQAVYCSVEVYMIIGYKFEPYLQKLPPNQQNLIRIFIRSRTSK